MFHESNAKAVFAAQSPTVQIGKKVPVNNYQWHVHVYLLLKKYEKENNIGWKLRALLFSFFFLSGTI